MDLSLNRQRNPDPVVAFKTLDSFFNVLQNFNTLGKKGANLLHLNLVKRK